MGYCDAKSFWMEQVFLSLSHSIKKIYLQFEFCESSSTLLGDGTNEQLQQNKQ
jgi:hypothetical protein